MTIDLNQAGPQRVKQYLSEPERAPEHAPRDYDVEPGSVLCWATWYSEILGCRVFAINDRKPLGRHGQNEASRDPVMIRAWFSPGWEGATNDIGIRTGAECGIVIVDVDVKDDGTNGWHSLELEYGVSTCPTTPLSHTPSGGSHLWFRHPGQGIFVRSTTGIPKGIDIKGDRSSCSVPPAPRRTWDEHLNPWTVPLAELPDWVPREKAERPAAPVQQRADHVAGRNDRYGRVALENAVKRILSAPNGEQQKTLNEQAYGIGRLVGGKIVPEGVARRALMHAATGMRAHKEPWRGLDAIVDRALAEGAENPKVLEDRQR